MTSNGAALLEGEKLLGAEALIMDLRGGFDEVLEMGAGEEVAEVDEFAMVLVFDINDAPAVLTASDLLSTNNDSLLRADDGEWNDVLDLSIEGNFFLVVLLIIVWIHAQVVESEFLSYPFLERSPLLQGQAITLGNDGHNVDEFREFLQNHNVNWLQAVTRRLDEEEAAVNAGILKVTLALGGQFFAKVCAVLILDVLDDRIPAPLIVHQVTISGSIDNIETQAHTVFLNEVRDGLNFGGRSNRLGWCKTTLAVNQMRGKDGVDQRGFPETSLANADDIELETALQQLLLDLLGDAVETDMAFWVDS